MCQGISVAEPLIKAARHSGKVEKPELSGQGQGVYRLALECLELGWIGSPVFFVRAANGCPVDARTLGPGPRTGVALLLSPSEHDKILPESSSPRRA